MIYYDTILSCCWAYLLTLQDQLALGFRMIQNAYNSKVQEPGESTTTGFLLKSPGFHVGSFPIPVFHVGLWVSKFDYFTKQSASRIAFRSFFKCSITNYQSYLKGSAR